MTTLATSNTPIILSMDDTNQVTKEEVDNVLFDIHNQRGTVCSISKTVFKDPVNTVDDQTYDRPMIQKWFDEGKKTSPLTGKELNDQTLTKNIEKQKQAEAIEALRSFVRLFLENRKKLSRLENLLEAKEKKEKEADEKAKARERKAKEAAEEERKRKEKAAAAEEERRQQEADEINRQKKEVEEQRQIAIQQKYQFDVQAYERSLGLA